MFSLLNKKINIAPNPSGAIIIYVLKGVIEGYYMLVHTIDEVKKLINNGSIKYIYSASDSTNETCQKLIDNYGIELITINTMETIDGGITNSNENYITIMNNNLELLNKELYK